MDQRGGISIIYASLAKNQINCHIWQLGKGTFRRNGIWKIGTSHFLDHSKVFITPYSWKLILNYSQDGT